MSFIIVLMIVIADTAIWARKDMNRKSQKAASVISSQKNGEDGKDKSGDTAETTKKDNSQSIINISGNNIRTRFKTPKGYKRNISKKSSPAALNCKPKPAFRRAIPTAAVCAHSLGETDGLDTSKLREAVASAK